MQSCCKNDLYSEALVHVIKLLSGPTKNYLNNKSVLLVVPKYIVLFIWNLKNVLVIVDLSCYSEFVLLLSDFNKGATLLWILWLGHFFGDGQLSFYLAEMTLEIYICVDNMCTWFLSICNLMITMQLFFHMVKNRYNVWMDIIFICI